MPGFHIITAITSGAEESSGWRQCGLKSFVPVVPAGSPGPSWFLLVRVDCLQTLPRWPSALEPSPSCRGTSHQTGIQGPRRLRLCLMTEHSPGSERPLSLLTRLHLGCPFPFILQCFQIPTWVRDDSLPLSPSTPFWSGARRRTNNDPSLLPLQLSVALGLRSAHRMGAEGTLQLLGPAFTSRGRLSTSPWPLVMGWKLPW